MDPFKANENHENAVSWIFFASSAKPTSMRRALAQRLAQIDPVVIVDQPVSLLRDKKIPAFGKRCGRLSGENETLHYQPIHFPEQVPGVGKILKELNQRRLQQELNSLLPKNGKRIVCYDSPTQDQLVSKLREDLSVYMAIDDRTLTVWGDPIQGEVEAEKRLLGKVDKVICVSKALADIIRSRIPTGRNIPIYVLPNGYDERLFDPTKVYPEPQMLVSIPRPRILVAGHVSERIDWEGIIRAYRLRPNWHWVFVGPADSGMKEKINKTLGINGRYHPPIPLTDVPAWIHHCEACAVPYRLNSFTRASHPLKALEYLAMGAPVLSTKIPSLERYQGVIEWVNEGDGESYARALDGLASQAGSQEIRELRRRAVSGDSWVVRVNQFRKIVFNAIS